MNNAYYSIKELASLIKVHESTIRRSIKNGRLQAFRIGTGKRAGWRIPASEINRIALYDMETIVKRIIENKEKM